MLLKLLYTVIIIGGILLVVKSRMGKRRQSPQDAAGAAPPGVNPRWVAYGITAFIVVTSVGITAWQWLAAQETVSIRVINSNTGQATVYTAYADEVGERSFQAADGTMVHLAPTERMEVMD